MRGYIFEDVIAFFKSSSFEEIKPFKEEYVDEVLDECAKYLPRRTYEIWNGLIPGNPGELWSPRINRGILLMGDKP
jgi:hypothetical protein